MKKILFFLSLIAALVCTSCVKDEPDYYGTITGIVKDAKTNQPLEGVKVTIAEVGTSQITNTDGQFTFENLDPKEYSLTFEKVEYLTERMIVQVKVGEQTRADAMLRPNLLGIDIRPDVLDFGTGATSLDLTVTAQSGKTVRFTVSSSASWLSVTPASSTTSSSTKVRAMVTRGTLSPGSYEATITFTANGESLLIPVYMQVAGAGQPVISVESITSVTQTTAVVAGVLTLEGGVTVSDYGVCYATNNAPTINNSKISRGGTSASTPFSCQLSGLSAGTEYYVRAYAVSGGQTYYGNTQSFTTTSQGGGSGGGTEDYSSAVLRSTNDYLTIELLSCKRLQSGNVLMETTILNTGVQNYTDLRIPGVGQGHSWDGRTWTTEVFDDLATDYNYYSLSMSLNGKSGNALSGGVSVPLNAKKKFSITIKNVPADAPRISVHLACMFYGYPCEYAYLTYDNVPIY